jgi:hypothetical protein
VQKKQRIYQPPASRCTDLGGECLGRCLTDFFFATSLAVSRQAIKHQFCRFEDIIIDYRPLFLKKIAVSPKAGGYQCSASEQLLQAQQLNHPLRRQSADEEQYL